MLCPCLGCSQYTPPLHMCTHMGPGASPCPLAPPHGTAETGLAAVQLTSDFSLHKLSRDDVSEYVGPLDAWEDA